MALWRSLGKHAAHLLLAIPLRKRWSLIITILITCIFISILSRYRHYSLRSDERRRFALSSEISASRLFEIGKQQDLQSQATEEFQSDVQEEEDSLKEGVDGGGSDTNGKQVQAGERAAHEVNVPEPEPHTKTQFPGQETIIKVTEEIFHRLNASQQLHKKPLSHIDNWHNFTKSEIDSLSIVGRRLFLQEDIGTPQGRNFTILAWQHGTAIARRFLRQYGKVYMDPFRFCSVRNCEITYNSSLLDTADAVLFHFHRTSGPSAFPNRTNFRQRWVWLADECPYHTFAFARDKNLSHYNGYFNWSMTYRKDSDVPVPYGRTVKMTDAKASLYEKVDYFNKKPNFTAAMGSNCGGKNKRWDYVRELQKYMDVDVYGACGTFKCPGHFTRDCEALNSYKFYLAFENANCREYLSEKVWWSALGKGAVPVVMGGKVEGYRKMLPPNSFIHIDEFQSPKHLANYLLSLAQDAAKYMQYHAWRAKFRVLNEHGYFGSPVFHYCRLCEALNYNDPAPKEYYHMEVFWNRETDCYQPTWVDRMNANSTSV